MAYIGKSIESGTFSVLDTSGNTYNGSNTTFNLGTQVGSVAQLLVSHDGVIQKPGTDYTLASGGTQITFTTAPASGASIFIVEISGAVGGPLDADLNGTELILDADGDTSLHASTDDQIDFKVANADQIKLTDGVLAPSTDNDIDLGTSSLEFKDAYFDGTITSDGGTFDTLGVGAAKDLGSGLHIKTGDSGNSVDANYDELVIEGSSNGGMTFAMGNSSSSVIAFSNSNSSDDGNIIYRNSEREFRFTTANTERMRLKSNGYLGITGTAGTGIERRLAVYGSHVSEDGLVWIQTSNGSGDDNLVLFFDGNTNNCGEITLNASANTVAYVTSSDYRLKQNATNISDGITRLKQLKPYRFQWKSDPDNTVDGFFAHEAQEIVPEAVTGTKDAMKTAENVVVNKDGSVECYNIAKADWEQGKLDGKYASNSTWEATKEVIDRQGIDQAKLVPLLTAALKEAVTKIEALEARVTTLEG
jgi:hypothetical protein